MSMPAPAVEGLGAAFGGRGRGDGGRGEGGAGEGGRRAGGAEEHLQGPRQEALPERCRNQRGCICMAGPAHCNAGPGTAAQAVQKGSQRLMLPLPASPVGEAAPAPAAGAPQAAATAGRGASSALRLLLPCVSRDVGDSLGLRPRGGRGLGITAGGTRMRSIGRHASLFCRLQRPLDDLPLPYGSRAALCLQYTGLLAPTRWPPT